MNPDGPFGSNKLLRYLSRVLLYQSGETPAPITMELDLTNRCNHRCPRCGGCREDQAATLRITEAFAYLKQMAQYGVRGVMVTGGGEPTLHPGVADVLTEGKRLGLDMALITNGSTMSDDLAATVAASCVWCRVSIDAGTAEEYRYSHGMDGHAFTKAWYAVHALAKARDDAESPLTVGVGYLTDSHTLRGMRLATERARDCGADYIQFRPYHRDQTPIAMELLFCRQLETTRFRVVSSAPKYATMSHARPYGTCHGSCFAGVIAADACVYLCCHLRGQAAWSLGSLREQSFRAIWEGPRRQELLADLDVRECLPQCRLDAANRWLESACQKPQHEAFL